MAVEMGDPRVVALNVQEEGLTADIVYDVSHADMDGQLKKTIEVWEGLTQGQKDKFNNFLSLVIGMLG